MPIRRSRFITIVLATIIVNLLLIYTVSGISSKQETAQTQPDETPRNGDLVFRSGKGIISDWFRRCSLSDPSYSHAGIIVQRNNENFVVHLQQTSSDGSLKVEKLTDFWSTQVCKGGAIYRLDLTDDEIASMSTEVEKDIQNGVSFDEHFNLDDDTRMYCSEWIRNKVIHATKDPRYFPVSVAGDFHYVAPDNLYINNHALLIYKFKSE
ncbi:MAG: YiiX/YebB-like N1pC/P60 family cysteine hydrolase [Bacteroidia bacterium]